MHVGMYVCMLVRMRRIALCNLSIYLSVCLSIYLSIYLSVYVHIHICMYAYTCTQPVSSRGSRLVRLWFVGSHGMAVRLRPQISFHFAEGQHNHSVSGKAISDAPKRGSAMGWHLDHHVGTRRPFQGQSEN